MSERIVVSCRMKNAGVATPPDGEARGYLVQARALAQRAEALGASLVSWSASTVAFAFEPGDLEEAIAFVKELRGDARVAPNWGSGIAQGDMEPLAGKGGGRADLAWGPPLVAAVTLARIASPGEVLVDASVKALQSKDLLALGGRLGSDDGRRVRGLRLDLDQPWRSEAALSITRVKTPALVGRADPTSLLGAPGTVTMVRADPGLGGTRMLAEIARGLAPAPCIVLMPAGASVEPLGALRRALVRALTTMPYPSDPELAPQLDMFLGGIGASIETATAILSALLRPPGTAESAPPAALIIDDAGEVDAESLEACAQLVAWSDRPFHVILRVDATDSLPSAFADMKHGAEIDLEPLGQYEGEALARALTENALQPVVAKRWARRGGFTPLGIVEAVQHGLVTGELAWAGDRAYARSRVAGRGKARPAGYWISKRAKRTAPDERGVLATVALFGGEVSIENAQLALNAVDAPIDVTAQVKKLVASRWLTETQPGWVALPTRTHRDTIAELLDEAPRRALHKAIAEVLEHSEGELGCAEAAHHAAKAGEGERAARLALRAARAAASAGMTKSANRLLTLARLADPKCEPLTRRALISSLPPPSAHVAKVAVPPAQSAPRGVPAADEPRAPVGHDADDAFEKTVPTGIRAQPMPPDRESGPTLVKSSPVASGHSLLPEPIPPPPPAPSVARPPPAQTDPRDRTLLGVAPAPPPLAPSAARPTRTNTVKPPPPLPVAASAAAAGTRVESVARPAAPPPHAPVPPPLPPRASVAAMPAVRIPAPPGTSPAVGPARIVPQGGAPLKPGMPPPRPSVTAMPAIRPRVPVADPAERAMIGVAPSSPIASPPAVPPSRAAVDFEERTIVSPAPRHGAPPPPPPPPVDAPVRASAAEKPDKSEKTDDQADAYGRLTALAKAALIDRDAGALERWSEGLRATGEHERFAERMEAMARLSRGHVGDALRVLKKARDDAASAGVTSRTQASIALGVALVAAGRPEEALLEALEALARAREKGDAKGASASLAFLSKLFAGQKRAGDATALRSAAKIA